MKAFTHTWVSSILIVVVLTLTLAWPVHALPPRPTPPPATPSPTPLPAPPTSSGPTGASIQLKVEFPQAWPWDDMHWQTLWTAVEWQDGYGDWHLVEGWRGSLDEVEVAATVTGTKTWWLTRDLCGRGPFRWVIRLDWEGPVLATSDPFRLPGTPGETLSVPVPLEEVP
jgi:hypothetical protein